MTVVIGTAGHIDHGKTTLLRALTGIDADRLPEEQRRGMTIDVGYAHLTLPDGRTLDLVDVPGHDRLVGNMLVGAGEIDAAMLVVAADDGPRAQTLEHLALLDALAISDGLVVITKIDIAGRERTAEVTSAVADLLAGTSLRHAVIQPASSIAGTGIEDVSAALVALATSLGERQAADARFASASGTRLAIDRVFTVKGRGAVVTGTLRGGTLVGGATLRLVPGDRAVRVREIQVHGRAVEAAGPGRTALNLVGAAPGDLRRGLVVTDDPTVVASDRLLVALRPAVQDRARGRVHLGTAAVDGAVGRSGRDDLVLPDGSTAGIVRLAGPIAVAMGDRFVIRRTGGTDRVIGGTVVDAEPARGISRRRQTADRVARLVETVTAHDARAVADARLDLHGAVRDAGGGETVPRLAPDVEAAVEAVVEAAVETAGELTLAAARALAARSLRRHVTIDRSVVTDTAAAVVDRSIVRGRLVRDGLVVRTAATAAQPTPAPDPGLAAAMDRLERTLAVAAPPSLADAARAAGCPPDGVRALERAGRIVVLEPDLAYAMTTYRDLAARALAMADRSPLTPAALRDATGTSRRYVMAILADLDRRGMLRRTADGHVRGPKAPVGRSSADG